MSTATVVKVGQLMCQRNPFMKTFTSKVVSCELAPAPPAMKKKEKDAAASPTAAPSPLYQIVCEDSILFPEGGGQPCDFGTINDTITVRSVQRQGDTCVIFASEPLEVGAEARMEVDWARRNDNMQHHTGQHLLTAIVERELGLPTESWALSYPACYLQLPLSSGNTGGFIPQADVDRVEAIVNGYIAKGVPVDLREFATREDVPAARSRSIPADVCGPIRIIDIASGEDGEGGGGNDGIDSCTCCGTHVTNLHQLQCLKLLHQEIKGGACKLHFIVGQRVLDQFGGLYGREKALVKEMGVTGDELVTRVAKRGADLAAATKATKKLLAEIAALTVPSAVAAAEAAKADGNSVHVLYREDGDGDFFAPILAACKPLAINLFFWGTSAADGGFLISGGSEEEVKRLGALVCAAADGKGGGKGDYRGKCDAKKLKRFADKELKAKWSA